MEKITVLLADSSAEYRMALREEMEKSGDFRVVGEAEDGQHTVLPCIVPHSSFLFSVPGDFSL